MSLNSFQIGTIAQPLEVLFGPSHYDKDSKIRAIKCFCDDEKLLEELRDIDPTLIKTDDITGRQVLRLKVWQSSKVHLPDSDETLTVDAIRRGNKLVGKVKLHHWQFEGQDGVSLTCDAILLLERNSTGLKWV